MVLTEEQWVSRLLDYLNASGARYCILRNYEPLPLRLPAGRDIDLLLDPSAARSLALALRALGAPIVYRRKRFGYLKFAVLVFSQHSMATATVDAFTELHRWGVPYVNARAVLESAVWHGRFKVPSPGAEAAILFLKDAVRGVVRDKYKKRIQDLLITDRTGLQIATRGTALEALAPTLSALMLDGDFTGAARLVSRAMKANIGIRLAYAALSRSVDELLHRARRGAIIALIGPDGAGKSTVARALMGRARNGFRAVKYKHSKIGILPELGRWRLLGQRLQGHRSGGYGSRARWSGLLTYLHFVYYGLDYFLGRALFGLWRFTGQFVVFDRYVHDFMIQSEYSRVPSWVRRAVCAVAPKPDVLVALYAEPECIRARKAELDVGEISKQLELASRIPGVRLVRTDGPADAAHEILCLVARALLGNPEGAASWTGEPL